MVAKKRRNYSGDSPFIYFIAMAIFVGATLVYIWPSVKIVSINKEYRSLEKEKSELSKRNRLLSIELQSLRSYEVIEEEAVKKGFRLPKRGEVVYLESDIKEDR